MNGDLDNLEERIKAASESHKEKDGNGSTLNAGIEFTAPIIGGILAGYFIDQYFDTAPIFIILLLLLGVGAGILNIYKISQNIGGTIGFSDLHAREKNAKTTPSNDSRNEESTLKDKE